VRNYANTRWLSLDELLLLEYLRELDSHTQEYSGRPE